MEGIRRRLMLGVVWIFVFSVWGQDEYRLLKRGELQMCHIQQDSVIRDILNNRVVIITGVGRSGTSIVGKLIGSMRKTCYVFEPAILKYAIPAVNFLPEKLEQQRYEELFRNVFFEDYILPIIQGRHTNTNSEDQSWTSNYMQDSDILYAHDNLSDRKLAVAYLQGSLVRFVIKTNEMQPYLSAFYDYFPNCYIVIVQRDKSEVVASAIKKGWFGESNTYIEWMNDDGKTPIWIDADAWAKALSQEQRAGLVWDTLSKCENDFLYEHSDSPRVIAIDYEELREQPKGLVLELEAALGMRRTAITYRHISDIIKHRSNKRHEK